MQGDPPANVHLVFDDGARMPLDCVLLGVDERGVYCWRVVQTSEQIVAFACEHGEFHIGIDVLPAMTSITFPEALIIEEEE